GLGLLLAGLAGVLAAMVMHSLNSPIDLGEIYQRGYYDAVASKIDSGDYYHLERRATTVAVAVGFVVGLAVLAAGTWVLSRPRRFLWPTLAATFLGLFGVGIPGAIGTAALIYALIGATTGQPGGVIDYRDFRGTKLTPLDYVLVSRRVALQSGVVGAIVGLLLTSGSVTVVRWRYRVAGRAPTTEDQPAA